MASTNRFQRAKGGASLTDENSDGGELSESTVGVEGTRGAGRTSRVRRRASRNSLRKVREVRGDGQTISGWPDIEGLKPVLGFLSLPAILVLAITLTGGNWPSSILYPIALVLGLVVGLSAFKGVELVLACMIIYLPFSKVFVVPIAPGVNGTNMLVLLGLFAALLRASAIKQKINEWPPGTAVVVIFGVISALSAFTITLLPGGRTYFIYNELLSYKAWVDQFIFYFILLMCIRDVESAKRCFIYMLIGSVLVVLYSVPEMLDKMGRSTIEKSRIEGPHLQSNNFGGFVAYTLLPLLAVFIVYIRDLRMWLLTPYFLVTLKVLISTFSRGAYLAMVLGGLMAGWYKGRGFLAFWISLALVFLLVFPSLIPDSVVARMGSLTGNEESSSAPTEETLDKSSSIRLIMWRAGAVMIMEDPIWGKGFKSFPFVKANYTEVPVKESDPHSMYMYIGTQMGLPALALFLLILGYVFNLGRQHASNKHDQFIRAIGIGGASATACYAVVCIFGSRAVSLNFTAYFWTLMVIMQVLKQQENQVKSKLNPRKIRSNALAEEGGSTRGVRRHQAEIAIANSRGKEAGSSRSSRSARAKRAKRREGKSGMRGAAAYQEAAVSSNETPDVDKSQDAEETLISKVARKSARRTARRSGSNRHKR